MTLFSETAHPFVRPTQQLRSRRSLLRLIEAAKVVLRRDGLESLTMGAVAEEAGVSVGGIYRRFENKEALLLAIHDTIVTAIEEALARELQSAKSLPDVVQGFVRSQTRLMESDQYLFGAIFSLGRHQPRQRARAQRGIEFNFAAFSRAALSYRSEIARENVELALATAFHLVYGAVMSKVGWPVAPPSLPLLTWEALEAELSATILTYLTAPVINLPPAESSPKSPKGRARSGPRRKPS